MGGEDWAACQGLWPFMGFMFISDLEGGQT